MAKLMHENICPQLTKDEYLLLYRQKVKRFAHNRLGLARRRVDTSDIAQEAYVQLLQTKGGFHANSEAEHNSLLAKIAGGHCHKQRRAHDAKCRDIGREEHVPLGSVLSPCPTPELTAERQELFKLLAEAISLLSEEQEYVVYRRFFDDLTLAEIARELNVTRKVCVRIFDSALKQMAQTLPDDASE